VIAMLAAVWVSAVAGSLHCAAMCGPLAGVAGIAEPGAPRWRPSVAYGGGRLAAYVGLGAIAGAIGAAIDLVSVGGVAMAIAGVAMLGWGAASLARALRGGGATSSRPGPMLYAIRRRRPVVRGALVGVLTAALPCGWLYAFVIVAAGTGSMIAGAAVMATFWLGTTPALLGAGLTLRAVARRLGRRLPLVTAGLQIALGVAVLAARAPMIDPPAAEEDRACH
jgi:uncharacterized protein